MGRMAYKEQIKMKMYDALFYQYSDEVVEGGIIFLNKHFKRLQKKKIPEEVISKILLHAVGKLTLDTRRAYRQQELDGVS